MGGKKLGRAGLMLIHFRMNRFQKQLSGLVFNGRQNNGFVGPCLTNGVTVGKELVSYGSYPLRSLVVAAATSACRIRLSPTR